VCGHPLGPSSCGRGDDCELSRADEDHLGHRLLDLVVEEVRIRACLNGQSIVSLKLLAEGRQPFPRHRQPHQPMVFAIVLEEARLLVSSPLARCSVEVCAGGCPS
jgi:hypothetical protein